MANRPAVSASRVADEVVDAGEVDAEAGLAGRDRQRDRNVGLADAWRAEQCDVAAVADEPERGEVADLAGVEVGLEREVEGVEGLVVRQPGQLERVAEPAAFADADLLLEDEVEKLQIAQLAGLRPVGERLGLLSEVRERQTQRMPADPVGHQGVAHAAPPTPALRPAAWS